MKPTKRNTHEACVTFPELRINGLLMFDVFSFVFFFFLKFHLSRTITFSVFLLRFVSAIFTMKLGEDDGHTLFTDSSVFYVRTKFEILFVCFLFVIYSCIKHIRVQSVTPVGRLMCGEKPRDVTYVRIVNHVYNILHKNRSWLRHRSRNGTIDVLQWLSS